MCVLPTLSNQIIGHWSLAGLLQLCSVDSAQKENILRMSVLQVVGITGMVTVHVCERYVLPDFSPRDSRRETEVGP